MTALRSRTSIVQYSIWLIALGVCLAEWGCGRTYYSSSPLISDWKIENQCAAMDLMMPALSGKGSAQKDDIKGVYKSSYDFIAPMEEKPSMDALAKHFAHRLRQTPGFLVRDVKLEKNSFTIAYAFSGEQGTNHGLAEVNVYLPTRPGNEVRFVTQFTETAGK